MGMILRSAWATMGLLILMSLLVMGAALPQAHGETAPLLPLPLPHLLLEHRDGTIHLSGTVPDEAERSALEQHLRRRYTGLPFHSRLQLGVVGNPNWLSAAFLPDLRGTTRATVTLADAALHIDADVPDDRTRRVLLAEVAQAQAAGLHVRALIAPR